MDSQYTKTTLSNGLNLLTIPMPSVESVTVLVMVHVGSRNETKNIRGLSHFLEHMPFKGTQKYPTSLALSSAVDSVGAEFNAFTGKEYTGFYVKAAANHLELCLDILSQLLFHPLIDEKEMEKEKGVIIEEINMYEDQPMAKIGLDFESLLYGNTALGWETVGTKQSIREMKRQNFIDYMNTWYRSDNMVIGIAGKVETQDLASLTEKYFNNKKFPAKNNYQRQVFSFSQKKPEILMRYKKTEQAHLCLGVRSYPLSDSRRYATALLASILGGNMSSRLFMEVREKRGLAYYVRTSKDSYTDNGYFVTQAGTAINKSAETIKVILEQYMGIMNHELRIMGSELTKAKEFFKGRLILGLEDSREVSQLYAEDYLLEGNIRTPKEIIKNIEKITLADLEKVAADIFRPQNLNLTIIGPYKDKDRQAFEKILK